MKFAKKTVFHLCLVYVKKFNMKLLCDENIPLRICKSISSKKHKVICIAQDYKGISDDKVFEIANRENFCIVTSDHHFDKYKHKKHHGIIRLNGNLKNIDDNLKLVLTKYKVISLENVYIKLNNNDYKVETNKYHKNKNKKEKYKFC